MLKKNDVIKGKDGKIWRILKIDKKWLVIDCEKKTMPQWIDVEMEYSIVDFSFESRILTPDEMKVARQRFTMVSDILPVIGDERLRCKMIDRIADEYGLTKQTIRKYLCLYLVNQRVECLAPAKVEERELSKDEKNMRWTLNKYFYTTQKHTLKTAYQMMLKDRYCDGDGKLVESYPSYYQFRYFYRKTKNLQNYYISREGLKAYQRDHRPLLGDGVQNYVGGVGTYMLDATVCDVYLVNETGGIVGRPILTAAVDAYSELCVGYYLSWEGGVYSLKNLVLNMVEDKVDLCRKHGIVIKDEDWGCKSLGGRFMTDMGKEYTTDNFAQLTELGITVTNLEPYRPDLKSVIERFFQIIQDIFKPYLKGKGVIEPDFQERGAHDYRLDACLTMEDFEKVILRCVVYYNSQRVLEGFQYSEEMIDAGIKPYSSEIWKWGIEKGASNLIDVSREQVILTLLPRTIGQFSKYGLKVNKLRYTHPNYIQQFLTGKKDVVVAFNPDNVASVWLIEDNGEYVKFELIESRFKNMTISEVKNLQNKQMGYINSFQKEKLQAELDLARHIQVIASGCVKSEGGSIKGIRENRKREIEKARLKEVKV